MKINAREGCFELWQAILATAASLLLYRFASARFAMIENAFLSALLAQAVFAAAVFTAVILLKKTRIYHSDPEKLAKGWTSGIVFIFVIASAGAQAYLRRASLTATPVEIMFFCCQMLLVGFCEESLYRGLIQNAFHCLFGEESRLSVLLAVFCAGMLFGATHLINAFNPEISLFTAAVQALGAAGEGMALGAVYFRTGKCLWYTIALHALNDLAVSAGTGRLSGQGMAETLTALSSRAQGAAAFVPFVFYGLIAVFLLRKKKVEIKE